MKKKLLRTLLVTLQMFAAFAVLCAMYVVYVPLAVVRALVDKSSSLDFMDCVDRCVNAMSGWFKKSAK